jgi:hypothetical protein
MDEFDEFCGKISFPKIDLDKFIDYKDLNLKSGYYNEYIKSAVEKLVGCGVKVRNFKKGKKMIKVTLKCINEQCQKDTVWK